MDQGKNKEMDGTPVEGVENKFSESSGTAEPSAGISEAAMKKAFHDAQMDYAPVDRGAADLGNWTTLEEVLGFPEGKEACQAIISSTTDPSVCFSIDFLFGEPSGRQPNLFLHFKLPNALESNFHSEIFEGVLAIDSFGEERFTFCIKGQSGDQDLIARLGFEDRERVLGKVISGTDAKFIIKYAGEPTNTYEFCLSGARQAMSRAWHYFDSHPKNDADLSWQIQNLATRVSSLGAVQIILAGALARLDCNIEQTISEMQQKVDSHVSAVETKTRFLLLIELFRKRLRDAESAPLSILPSSLN